MKELRAQLEEALSEVRAAHDCRRRGDPGPPPEIALEVPRNPEHGDFACNAAMLLPKRLQAVRLGTSPTDLMARAG